MATLDDIGTELRALSQQITQHEARIAKFEKKHRPVLDEHLRLERERSRLRAMRLALTERWNDALTEEAASRYHKGDWTKIHDNSMSTLSNLA